MRLIKKTEMEDAITEARSGVMAAKAAARHVCTTPPIYKKLNKECTADIILNKKTKAASKTLVLIPSRQIYMIYDEIKKTKTVITSKKQISSFFTGTNSSQVIIKKGEFSLIDRQMSKFDIINLYEVVYSKLNENPGVLYAIKKNAVNLLGAVFLPNRANDLYEVDPKLIKFVYQYVPELLISQSQFDFIKTVYNVFGWDILKKCFKYGMLDTFYGCDEDELRKYNLDGTRFAEYLTTDLMAFESPLPDYYDYLRMSLSLYGKIEDKYPKNLLTEHDKVMNLLNEKNELQKDNPEFSTVMEECEDFSYYNALDKFKIIMPKEAIDLVKEGTELGHCVSTYAPKVVSGDCIIVFMRTMKDPDVPYLTVEVSPGRKVTEIEGLNKRTELTKDEIVFLNRWATNKCLTITSPNAIMVESEKKSS